MTRDHQGAVGDPVFSRCIGRQRQQRTDEADDPNNRRAGEQDHANTLANDAAGQIDQRVLEPPTA
ncbi:MAG TPA: hypothetical protein VKF35_12950 [Hyphomicrobiaceae bacterium]|nr:hypothetical protein [Hyphomicrobiaceae bacterium]